MKQRSERRLGWPALPRSVGGLGGGADRISAVPDDPLHLILVRLGCATTAARAGLLSRRWRGIWTRLPELVFPDVDLHCLEQGLASVISSTFSDAVFLLDICLHSPDFDTCPGECVSSLLRTAAQISPERLVLALQWCKAPYSIVELPCFTRATSISLLAGEPIILRRPPDAFPALGKLVLTNCAVDDLAALVLCCPYLRVLWLVRPGPSSIGMPLDISVCSASLRELVPVDST